MRLIFDVLVLVTLGLRSVTGQSIRDIVGKGPGALKLHLLEQEKLHRVKQDQPSSPQRPLIQSSEFSPRYFLQPLDHFASTNDTFLQRYWVSTRHYTAGGPVFVLDGGETSGEDRLPFLDTGILNILANATGGLSIVLEHRYYGTSIPVANFSTDSLRWLNNAQSAADSANFMTNVNIAGLNETVTAPNRPWIYYGGSYAGARAAHMRVLYPSIVYGAIASSAVTHATLYNWEYGDLIRNYTSPACRHAVEHSVKVVDHMLAGSLTRSWVKALFGLLHLRQDQDFVSVLQSAGRGWQAKNWDPAVGSTEYDAFCDYLVGGKPHGWGDEDSKTLDVSDFVALGEDVGDLAILVAGAMMHQKVHYALFNYARYVRKNIVSHCVDRNVEDCFGTTDPTKFQDISDTSSWRAWTFQVCTEWGYFFTAPPNPKHPTLVSRLLDLEYVSRICKLAFPPGQHFAVPNWPNVTAVNALGDFDLAADRLAFIDGEFDPWRPCTPHSDYASPRNDTILRPFKVIPRGVHHWDENGLHDPTKEPADIQKIHREQVAFVKEWLKDWDKNVISQSDT